MLPAKNKKADHVLHESAVKHSLPNKQAKEINQKTSYAICERNQKTEQKLRKPLYS